MRVARSGPLGGDQGLLLRTFAAGGGASGTGPRWEMCKRDGSTGRGAASPLARCLRHPRTRPVHLARRPRANGLTTLVIPPPE